MRALKWAACAAIVAVALMFSFCLLLSFVAWELILPPMIAIRGAAVFGAILGALLSTTE